jgi:hypothetical protein
MRSMEDQSIALLLRYGRVLVLSHSYPAANVLRFIIDHEQFYSSISQAAVTKLSQWKEAHDEILNCVEDFWACIQHILCADAPEGLVPDDIDEDVSLDTKEILSYSWRGLKEARCVHVTCTERC